MGRIITQPAQQLSNLGKLNVNYYKMAGQVLELPSSVKEIHAHDCRSKEEYGMCSGIVTSTGWHGKPRWRYEFCVKTYLCRLSVFIYVIHKHLCSSCWYVGSGKWWNSRVDKVWQLGKASNNRASDELAWKPTFLGFIVSSVYRPCYSVLISSLNINGTGFWFED